MSFPSTLMRDVVQAPLGEPRFILDTVKCEQSLLEFMKQGWESVEPASHLYTPWSLEAICEHLEAVTAGQLTRLLINVPPGCTKSMSTNVFWPSWEWGPKKLPQNRFISASHEQGLSIRDMVRGRDLMLSEWYQARWGLVVGGWADSPEWKKGTWEFKGDANAKVEYHNDLTGWRKASSTGSGLTGYRADRLLLDDPHAVRDLESDAERENALRWFAETLPTRLNNPAPTPSNPLASAIVVIMQRIHERDVSGLILKEDLGYEHLCLPMEYESKRRCFTTVPREGMPVEKVAKFKRDGEPVPRWVTPEELTEDLTDSPLAPEDRLGEFQEMTAWDNRTEEGQLLDPIRFPLLAVEQLKAAFRSWGGSYAEAGQLQQRPAPRGGGLFQRKDFNFLDQAPAGLKWIRGYDLASTREPNSPWTVGCKMGIDEAGRIIIADIDRRRATPGEVDEMMAQLAEQDGVAVEIDFPQDPGQAGKSQVSYIKKQLVGYSAWSSPETGSKLDRAKPLAAQAEGGNLYLVRGPWNDAFINEACGFPNGEYKDQIDAATRAFTRANRKTARRLPIAGGMLIEA